MGYRLFSGAIVVFWCVMSFLLVRVVVSPENSGLLDVPVAHVIKMAFIGGQTSELSIMENGRASGSFSLRPDLPHPDGGRTLLYSGNLALSLPFMTRQRAVWQGSVTMDKQFHVTGFQGLFGVRDSPSTIHLEYSPGENVVRYQVKGEKQTATFPLDDAGAAAALKALGIDTNAVEGIRKGLGTPGVTAKRSFLKIRNEKIEAYVVTIRQGDSPLAEIYVSQLGQILFVHTSFGYTMGGEDITP